MNNSVQIIPLWHLAMAFIPVVVVAVFLYRWSLDVKNAVYAVSRMLFQLMIIGYFLAYIFEANSAWIVLIVLVVMVFTSSWIALRTVEQRIPLYKNALFALLLGASTTLLLVTQIVLDLEPWFTPRFVIPLAGMIFAGSMNSISLAAERLAAELSRDVDYGQARNTALRAALIPITNSLFAVGLVSLPGMMTGQILSGVSPLIAARYQIMVMCMTFGASGISAALFLKFGEADFRRLIKFDSHDSQAIVETQIH